MQRTYLVSFKTTDGYYQSSFTIRTPWSLFFVITSDHIRNLCKTAEEETNSEDAVIINMQRIKKTPFKKGK